MKYSKNIEPILKNLRRIIGGSIFAIAQTTVFVREPPIQVFILLSVIICISFIFMGLILFRGKKR